MKTNAHKTLLAFLLSLLSLSLLASAAEDFTAIAASQISLCPCSGEGFYLTITNTGTVESTYVLSTDQITSPYVSFQANSFSLKPNQATKVGIFITTPCSQSKPFQFPIIISTKAGTTKAIKQIVSIADCYGFTLDSGKIANISEGQKNLQFTAQNSEYTLCANEVSTIPLLFTNKDTRFDNSYSLSLDGPSYASLLSESFPLKKSSSGIVLLQLNPNNAEKSSVTISATASKGEKALSKKISFNTIKCHDLELQIDTPTHSGCAGDFASTQVRIINNGPSREDLLLSIEPSWASLNRTDFTLTQNRLGRATILLNPPKELKGEYEIKVSAVSQNNPDISVSKSIALPLTDYSSCYSSSIGSEQRFSFSEEAYLPITIQNSGSKEGEFSFSLQGGDFASLVDSKAKINPSQSFSTLIHLSPNNLSYGEHKITVISSSDKSESKRTITINHNESSQLLLASKYLLFQYRYYWYVLAIILLLLFIFRKKIASSVKESIKQRRIASARKAALRAAREAREEKSSKKESKKEVESDSSFGIFGWGSILLLALAILIGSIILAYPTLARYLLERYGLIALVIGMIIFIVAMFEMRKGKKNR